MHKYKSGDWVAESSIEQPSNAPVLFRGLSWIFILIVILGIAWITRQMYIEHEQRQVRHQQALEHFESLAPTLIHADLPSITESFLNRENNTVQFFKGSKALYLFSSGGTYQLTYSGKEKTYGKWNAYVEGSKGHYYVISYTTKYLNNELTMLRGQVSQIAKEQVIQRAFDESEYAALPLLGVTFEDF